MATYRKKPVVVTAIQWTGNNQKEIYDLLPKDKSKDDCFEVNEYGLFINTLEGRMSASIGDYIIKGVNGEFYPCKQDIFDKTYEKCEEEPKILKQYDEKGNLENYWVRGEKNPCGCGSNLFHYQYDGDTIVCVCNSCKAEIYTIKDEYKEEELKKRSVEVSNIELLFSFLLFSVKFFLMGYWILHPKFDCIFFFSLGIINYAVKKYIDRNPYILVSTEILIWIVSSENIAGLLLFITN